MRCVRTQGGTQEDSSFWVHGTTFEMQEGFQVLGCVTLAKRPHLLRTRVRAGCAACLAWTESSKVLAVTTERLSRRCLPFSQHGLGLRLSL